MDVFFSCKIKEGRKKNLEFKKKKKMMIPTKLLPVNFSFLFFLVILITTMSRRPTIVLGTAAKTKTCSTNWIPRYSSSSGTGESLFYADIAIVTPMKAFRAAQLCRRLYNGELATVSNFTLDALLQDVVRQRIEGGEGQPSVESLQLLIGLYREDSVFSWSNGEAFYWNTPPINASFLSLSTWSYSVFQAGFGTVAPVSRMSSFYYACTQKLQKPAAISCSSAGAGSSLCIVNSICSCHAVFSAQLLHCDGDIVLTFRSPASLQGTLTAVVPKGAFLSTTVDYIYTEGGAHAIFVQDQRAAGAVAHGIHPEGGIGSVTVVSTLPTTTSIEEAATLIPSSSSTVIASPTTPSSLPTEQPPVMTTTSIFSSVSASTAVPATTETPATTAVPSTTEIPTTTAVPSTTGTSERASSSLESLSTSAPAASGAEAYHVQTSTEVPSIISTTEAASMTTEPSHATTASASTEAAAVDTTKVSTLSSSSSASGIPEGTTSPTALQPHSSTAASDESSSDAPVAARVSNGGQKPLPPTEKKTNWLLIIVVAVAIGLPLLVLLLTCLYKEWGAEERRRKHEIAMRELEAQEEDENEENKRPSTSDEEKQEDVRVEEEALAGAPSPRVILQKDERHVIVGLLEDVLNLEEVEIVHRQEEIDEDGTEGGKGGLERLAVSSPRPLVPKTPPKIQSARCPSNAVVNPRALHVAATSKRTPEKKKEDFCDMDVSPDQILMMVDNDDEASPLVAMSPEEEEEEVGNNKNVVGLLLSTGKHHQKRGASSTKEKKKFLSSPPFSHQQQGDGVSSPSPSVSLQRWRQQLASPSPVGSMARGGMVVTPQGRRSVSMTKTASNPPMGKSPSTHTLNPMSSRLVSMADSCSDTESLSSGEHNGGGQLIDDLIEDSPQ